MGDKATTTTKTMTTATTTSPTSKKDSYYLNDSGKSESGARINSYPLTNLYVKQTDDKKYQ
jgi:hypothetical protein